MKPGVCLNDGGKLYGGKNYNVTRQNQQDLNSYKKYREQVSTEAEQKTAETIKRAK
jgi:hypothetical protein